MNSNRLFFFLGFILFSLTASGQQKKNAKYTLTGNIEGLVSKAGYAKGKNFTAGYVYLSGIVRNGAYTTDSAKLTDGRFIFTGNVDEPSMAYIFCKPGERNSPVVLMMFLENSNISVTGKYSPDENSVKDPQIKGSAVQDEYAGLFENANNISGRTEIRRQYEVAMKKNDTAKLAALRKEGTAAMEKYTDYMREYTSTHPASFVNLYLLSDYIPREESGLTELENELKKFDKQLQSSFLAKNIISAIADQRKRLQIGPGIQAIDFSQPGVDGKIVKLSDYAGKYVLLDFWASWCGPCRAENPNVLKAYNTFNKKGLEILSVSLDENRAAWLKAVKADKLPWLQVSDLKGWKNEAGSKYMIQSIPENFLIDPNGKIVAKGLRGEQLHKELEKIFHRGDITSR
ncbi:MULTISPECIES: TlpA disulfide reductase family protein [unclassified Chitinophaga]|uniref:TlpA disulfide reductase family protein n=1 Tax=unclassified Chitinophaga TaxID=2619133 RepID=UPI00301009EE